MELTYTVPADKAGHTLRGILQHELRLSATQIRRLKAANALLVNGKAVYAAYPLAAGDQVFLQMTESAPAFPAEEGPLDILYEDDMLLAVDKPQGLIVHPTHSRYTGTLANFAWKRIRDSGGDGCHAVNRLDRDTGGVVLFAKNAWACSRMTAAVTEKLYLAVVCGEPAAGKGSMTQPIRRLAPGELRRVCAPDGNAARTDYRVLASREGLSLLSLSLFTGRTHQIRVHCAQMGWPVLGDRLYGTPASLARAEGEDQAVQALWCVRMTCRHPVHETLITLTAVPKAKIFKIFDFSY